VFAVDQFLFESENYDTRVTPHAYPGTLADLGGMATKTSCSSGGSNAISAISRLIGKDVTITSQVETSAVFVR
jgi:hypothetical protein